MTAVVIYYDSLNGLGALRMDVSEGTNVYAAFHAEAKHRQIPVPSFLGWETMDQLRKAEKLQELVAGIRPTETPFFMAARRIGKSQFAREYAEALEAIGKASPKLVIEDEIEAPNKTPPGLLCVSPMDGRLGNRWSPQ